MHKQQQGYLCTCPCNSHRQMLKARQPRGATLPSIQLCMQRVECSPLQAPVGEQQPQQPQQQVGMPALAPASEAEEEPLPTEAAHPEAHRMGSKVCPRPRVLKLCMDPQAQGGTSSKVCTGACSADGRVRGIERLSWGLHARQNKAV